MPMTRWSKSLAKVTLQTTSYSERHTRTSEMFLRRLDTTMTENTDEVILVNDLDSLREAIGWLCADATEDTPLCNQAAIDTLVELVPRLIKSYEDVLEASMQLTELVARLLEEQQKSSLFIPPTGSGWSKQKNW